MNEWWVVFVVVVVGGGDTVLLCYNRDHFIYVYEMSFLAVYTAHIIDFNLYDKILVVSISRNQKISNH